MDSEMPRPQNTDEAFPNEQQMVQGGQVYLHHIGAN